MVTKLLNHIESYIESSSQSFYLFAEIVNDLEFFAEQNGNIFSDETRQQYWNEYNVFGLDVKIVDPIRSHKIEAFIDAWE